MTIDSLIQFIALIVAFYAIVPTSRQKVFDFLFTKPNILFSVFCIVIIHVLLFFDYFVVFGLVNKWPYIVENETFAYLILVFYFIIEFIIITTRKLSLGNIRKYSELLDSYYRNNEFEEINYLFEKEYARIFSLYEGKIFLLRIKKKLYNFGKISEVDTKQLHSVTIQGLNSKRKNIRGRVEYFIYRTMTLLFRKVYYFLPNHESEQIIAGNILRKLLYSEEYVNYLVITEPFFGLAIIQKYSVFTEGFLEIYISSLLRSPRSILFEEVKFHSINEEYDFSTKNINNRFLFFFLHDLQIACSLYLGSQISRSIVTMLDNDFQEINYAYYNKEIGDYYEISKYKCPLFIGISCIDIIVNTALHQNYKWHMELFSVYQIVNSIIKHYSYRVNKDHFYSSVWNSKFSYLLIEIFNTMINWIMRGEELSITIDNSSPTHENTNIPKSSIICMTLCLNSVISSDNIEDKTKNEIVERIVRLYFHFSKDKKAKRYKKVLIKCIKDHGGSESVNYIRSELENISKWIHFGIDERVYLINKLIE